MEKWMEQIKVSTRDGAIFLEQGDDRDDSFSSVSISPDQVEVLCKWLQEAKLEAENMAQP
jgi:hypothetical protein